MQIDKFIKDSVILTLSNLATGIIGFLFSVIISRRLGAEGLGLYGIVMPVYGLLLCLTSEGLITAVSKISAVYFRKKDFKNVHKTVTTVLVLVFLWSLCIALLTFVTSAGISDFFIRDKRASNAVKILCPALVFVPLSSIIKGYFYGLGKFRLTSSIDIVEKLLRVFVLLGSISVFAVNDVESMVSAAYFALAAGEMTSFIILYLFYKRYRNRNRSPGLKTKSRIQLVFDVLVIASPLCINGFLSSILSAASTLILPRRLVQTGFTYNEALALIGKFSGMALNIVHLPSIIISSMLTVLIPDLSTSLSKKDAWAVENRINQVLKTAGLVGIATAAIALTIPELLGELLYGDPELGDMIRFAAIIGFADFISFPTFGILNGLGKQSIILRNSLLVSVEGLVLIFIFAGIPFFNIYGFGISLAVTSVTALIINVAEIRKYCEVRFAPADIVTVLLAGILAFLLLKLVNLWLVGAYPVIRAVVVVLTGFLSVYVLNVLSEKVG